MTGKKTQPPIARKPLNYRHIAVIVGLAAVVFANSLPGSFVWDDEIQVVKNWRIRSFNYLPSAFTSAFWSFLGTEAESQSNFYRPVQTITYMAAYSIGALSPAPYHTFSLAYHVAASAFVYLICLELMFQPAAALVIAALFAAHPVHTEAVAWIAGIPDVACGAFYFGSVWLFLRYLKSRRTSWLLGSCLMFFAALLAKEMAVTLPAFLLLLMFRDRARASTRETVVAGFSPRSFYWALSPFILVFGIYLLMRVAALGLLARAHVDIQAGWLDWFSLGIRVFAEYVRYALVPYPLNAFHLLPVKLEYRIASTVVSLVVVLALIALSWILRRRVPDAPFWFAGFALMLIPVFYFKGISNVFFAERYLYIPSFAMIALVVCLASSFNIPRLNFLLLSLSLVFAIAAAYRNEVWRTSETLYQATLRVQPEVVHMRNSMADILMKRGEDSAALNLLESSVEYMQSDRYVRFPYELYRAYVGLGAIEARAGRYAAAREHFQKSIQVNPSGDWGYLYLGGVFMEADGDYERAIANFQKAIDLGPLNEVARDYLGIAMLNQKHYKEAIRYFEEALKINPNYEDARSHLAIASRGLTP